MSHLIQAAAAGYAFSRAIDMAFERKWGAATAYLLATLFMVALAVSEAA